MKERINITLPKSLLEKADKFCKDSDLYRSTYIEMLIRADLKKRTVSKMETVKYWDSVDDMPLKPKMRIAGE